MDVQVMTGLNMSFHRVCRGLSTGHVHRVCSNVEIYKVSQL